MFYIDRREAGPTALRFIQIEAHNVSAVFKTISSHLSLHKVQIAGPYLEGATLRHSPICIAIRGFQHILSASHYEYHISSATKRGMWDGAADFCEPCNRILGTCADMLTAHTMARVQLQYSPSWMLTSIRFRSSLNSIIPSGLASIHSVMNACEGVLPYVANNMERVPFKQFEGPNYARLADLMGTYGELAIFRKFETLNKFNLLSLQAELTVLEAQLDKVVLNDEESDKRVSRQVAKDFWTMRHELEGQKQQQLLILIRGKLREYNTLDADSLFRWMYCAFEVKD